MLKNQVDINQKYLLKNKKIDNNSIQTQNDSTQTKNDQKVTQNDSLLILNDGFPIADSELPEIKQKKPVEHLPFCIVIPSFNNAKNNLYKKNLNSILQQEYMNYHVVYLDDKSDDDSTLHAINYLKKIFN